MPSAPSQARAAGELADRPVEHRELRAARPGAVDRRARVVGDAVRQRQHHAEHVLRDRGRAVVADVADRDAMVARGLEVDVVGAGRGQRDQLQRRRRGDQRAVDAQLVQQHDLMPRDARRHVVLPGRRQQLQPGDRTQQPTRVQVARAHSFVVEEYRLHRGILKGTLPFAHSKGTPSFKRGRYPLPQ
jgi:hypothetical protein